MESSEKDVQLMAQFAALASEISDDAKLSQAVKANIKEIDNVEEFVLAGVRTINRMVRTEHLKLAFDLARSMLILASFEDISPRILAATYHALGNIASSCGQIDPGDPDGAEAWYRKALDINERLAPESMSIAATYHALGNIVSMRGQIDRGDPDGAEAWYRKALDIHERLAPGSMEIAATYYALGNIASSRGQIDPGDPDGAEAWHRKALEIHERLAPSSIDIAATYHALGNIASMRGQIDRGDPDGAEAWYRKALDIHERLASGSMEIAATYHALGNIADSRGQIDAGDPDGAEAWYRKALEIEERLAPGSTDVAATYHALGNIVSRRGQVDPGDPDGAEAWYRKALEIHERLAPGSMEIAATYHALGNIASKRGQVDAGDPDGAEAWYRKALEIEERLAPGSLVLLTSYHSLALVSEKNGESSEAIAHLNRAWALLKYHAIQLGGARAEGLLAQNRPVFLSLVALLRQEDRIVEAAAIIDEVSCLTLTANFTLREESATESILLSQISEWDSKLSALSAQAEIQLKNVDKSPEDIHLERQTITDIRSAVGARNDLALKLVSLRLGTTNVPQIDERSLTELANQDIVILSYSEEMGLIHCSGQGKTEIFSFPQLNEEQSALLHTSLAILNVLEAPEGANEPMKMVYARLGNVGINEWQLAAKIVADFLIPPSIRAAIGSAKQLVIVPDGFLWRVPFGALTIEFEDGLAAIGTKVEISISPGLRIFFASQASALKGNPNAEVFAAGINSFGGSISQQRDVILRGDGRKAGNLVHAVPEVKDWETILAAVIITDFDVTPKSVWEKARGKATWVFASHGALDPADPFGSGVVVHPIDDKVNTIIKGHDFITQHPENLRLVYFSCCALARGVQRTGAGFMGLPSALLRIGVPAVYSALYPVSDEESSRLSAQFAKNLKKLKTPGAAWKETCQWAVRRGMHPRHWAAFVGMGDTSVQVLP